jgi:hypothetical protein
MVITVPVSVSTVKGVMSRRACLLAILSPDSRQGTAPDGRPQSGQCPQLVRWSHAHRERTRVNHPVCGQRR